MAGKKPPDGSTLQADHYFSVRAAIRLRQRIILL
jgi:hypothetical protein